MRHGRTPRSPSTSAATRPAPSRSGTSRGTSTSPPTTGASAGYVRIGLYPNLGAVWYWACVVGEGRPLVTVIDHEVAAARRASGRSRSAPSGLWADHTCETPLDHFSLGLEAFGVALDDPAEVYGAVPRRPGADRLRPRVGDRRRGRSATRRRRPATRCRAGCTARSSSATRRIDFDGHGQRDHSWGVRDWWTSGVVLDRGPARRRHPLPRGDAPARPGSTGRVGYVQPPGGVPEPITGFTVEHDRRRRRHPVEIRLAARRPRHRRRAARLGAGAARRPRRAASRASRGA